MSTEYPARTVQNIFNLLLRGDVFNLSLMNRAFSFLLLLLFTYFKTRFRT